jgi:hypothetical protein
MFLALSLLWIININGALDEIGAAENDGPVTNSGKRV